MPPPDAEGDQPEAAPVPAIAGGAAAELAAAAQAAGIDPAFLDALPAELRAEVLTAHREAEAQAAAGIIQSNSCIPITAVLGILM